MKEGFINYPRPIRAPDVPDITPKKSNPKLYGWILLLSAFLIEWIPVIRQWAWVNAGFDSLRRVREEIEHTEPRFDPTVIPLGNDSIAKRQEILEVEAEEELPSSCPSSSPSEPECNLPLNSNWTVEDYRKRYLSGELTPLDVISAILPLIRRDALPPGKHSLAWFDVKVDLVLEAARESTLRYQKRRTLGPLDGIPTAVKDEYDMEGYITTLGSVNDYTGRKLDDMKMDSWCVKKLQEAGVIILGKLSMQEFGLDTCGNNTTYSTPRNPYNPDYYPGGSSSGSAYAVANGLVPFTLGSDGGGSIRIPSSFCSVFGLKPTHGRISHLPGENYSETCGVLGPIASTMSSLTAAYTTISKPHPTSHFPSPSPWPVLSKPPRPKLLGIPQAWVSQAAPSVQSLFRRMVTHLTTQKGYSTVPINIPFTREGQISHAMTVLTDAATLLPDVSSFAPATRVLLALGRTTPSTDYLLAQKLRAMIMHHLSYLFHTFPGMVILTPTTACAGWRIKSPTELKTGVSDGDTTMETMRYCWMANFCGLPGLSVPMGYVVRSHASSWAKGQAEEVNEIVEEGTKIRGMVPVGLMATGEWAGEEILLGFGRDVEDVLVAQDILARPPEWDDIVARATECKGTMARC